jgi:hypothetical protein
VLAVHREGQGKKVIVFEIISTTSDAIVMYRYHGYSCFCTYNVKYYKNYFLDISQLLFEIIVGMLIERVHDEAIVGIGLVREISKLLVAYTENSIK